MKISILAVVSACCVVLIWTTGSSTAADKSGEYLFKEHCVACHPDGGNIVNPKKTLKKKDLQSNKAATVEAIVKIMRNPGPGMLQFDSKTIPDKDARAIAEYILNTFTK